MGLSTEAAVTDESSQETGSSLVQACMPSSICTHPYLAVEKIQTSNDLLDLNLEVCKQYVMCNLSNRSHGSCGI